MARRAGRRTVLLAVLGLVIAGVIADLTFERDEFPSAAVVLAVFVASAFLSVGVTALTGLVVAIVGIVLAILDYDGAGLVTRITFFVLGPLIAVVIAVIRHRREVEIADARVDLALREAEIAAAHRFQRALLPRRLPRSNAYELSSRYRAAAVEAEIGGDWFDAIEAGDVLTLIIGDVAGSGLEAAAAMAAARHATAMAALGTQQPARVLEDANDYVRRFADTMATCLVIRFDLASGTAITASAGHPPIVVATAGCARLEEVPPGLPLGVADDSRYQQYPLELSAGSTIVLYTDGLVERRSTTLDEGLERLLALMRRSSGHSLERLCDRLLTEFADGSEDDVALLAARFTNRAFTNGGGRGRGRQGEPGVRTIAR